MQDVLAHVRAALDEFDEQPLEVSARRAFRIARARGDAEAAHRLMLELRFGTGDADTWWTREAIHGESDRGVLARVSRPIVDAWMDGRQPSKAGHNQPSPPADPGEAQILVGSIVEMQFQLDYLQQLFESEVSEGNWEQVSPLYSGVLDRKEIMERIRQWVYEYLANVETQVASSDVVSKALARHRRRVDLLLDERVPDVRDRLGAALRVAAEGDAESRAQVLVTCRRVLVAIADCVYPASDEPHLSGDGRKHQVQQGNYRNRIVAAVEDSTAGRAAGAAADELADRLEKLDRLLNAGVHADVSETDMEFGLVQTYFLAGEILAAC